MSRTIEAIIKHAGATSEKKSVSATSQTMKAIRIHNYGGPEVLKYEDAPRPEPQAGEVLVRVHAAGVNPIDWKVREGRAKEFLPHKFPLVLGWDLSGVVEGLGKGVSRFKMGERCWSKTRRRRTRYTAEQKRFGIWRRWQRPKMVCSIWIVTLPTQSRAGEMIRGNRRSRSGNCSTLIRASSHSFGCMKLNLAIVMRSRYGREW